MTHRPVIAAVFVLILGPDSRLRAADPPSPSREPLHRVVDLDVGESRQVELARRGEGPGEARGPGGISRPDPRRRPTGRGQGRGQRAGDRADLGDLSSAPDGRRRPGRLPDHAGLHDEYRPGPLGPDQGRAAAALAGRFALGRAGDVRLSGPPALVRQRDPDGQRADVRRRHRKPGRAARSTTTAASTSAAPRGWWTSSPRPTDWSSPPGKAVCPVTRTRPSIRDTTSSTCSTIAAGTTATATSSRSTPRSSRVRRSPWGRRSACSARKAAAAAGRTCTSRSSARQPSGRWGTEEGYAFLWQAALREQQPEVVAVARPASPGAGRATRSRSTARARGAGRAGSLVTTGPSPTGPTASGPRVERAYDRARRVQRNPQGHRRRRQRRLRLRDRAGARPRRSPSRSRRRSTPRTPRRRTSIRGDPITFKVRTFGTTDGKETWDFGDGTPPVEVHSDGNVEEHAPDGYAIVTHRFARPGDYLPRVERTDAAAARRRRGCSCASSQHGERIRSAATGAPPAGQRVALDARLAPPRSRSSLVHCAFPLVASSHAM